MIKCANLVKVYISFATAYKEALKQKTIDAITPNFHILETE